MKRYTPLKRSMKPIKRTPLKTKGKKGNQWAAIRETLVPWFRNAGFTTCEMIGCWNSGFFAHAKIRDKCNENDLYVVAHLCNSCHDRIETKDEAMEAIILSIRRRNYIPELQLYLEKYTYLKDYH